MADISMCEGHECPKKQECYRYTAPVNPHRQSYFVFTPYDHTANACSMFTSNDEKKKVAT